MAKAKQSQATTNQQLVRLEKELEKVFVGKAPALPDSVKQVIATLAPWLVALSMVLVIPVLLAFFGISVVAMPVSFLGGLDAGFSYILSMVFFGATVVLELMALPGLFKRQERAWRLMFYSTLLSLVHSVINFDLGSLVIGGAISFYFLFQVKSKYTK